MQAHKVAAFDGVAVTSATVGLSRICCGRKIFALLLLRHVRGNLQNRVRRLSRQALCVLPYRTYRTPTISISAEKAK